MSKFPNQLAIVGVLGVSAIALSVGFSERAAKKAEEAAHEAALRAAATQQSVAEPEVPAEEVSEAAAAETAPAEATESVAAMPEAGDAPAEEVAATPAAEEAAAEEVAASAPEEADVAGSGPVIGTNADTLDDKPAMASTMINGHGSTAEIRGSLEGGRFGLGRPALPEEIAAWDLDISPDGTGLPEGSGDVYDGEEIFAEYCAVCHGDFAEGVDNWPKLAGGMGTLDREDPLKTVGSYWPYLSTTFDYVRRSMPFGNAQTLTDDEVYAIVAYILYSNDLVDDEFELSHENFLEVEMPNADGFFVDDRAETEYGQFSEEPCMTDCKEAVEITMRAAVLDVTPEETKARTIEKLIKETDPKAPKPAAAAAAEETEVAAAAPAETAPADAAPAEAAAPDPELVAAGEKVFRKCQACHQVGEDAKNKTGPVLNGIVGSAAAQVEDFKYSKVFVEAGADGLVWTEDELAAYLTNPKSYLKGNRMAFAGLKKEDDIAAVIAYLRAHP